MQISRKNLSPWILERAVLVRCAAWSTVETFARLWGWFTTSVNKQLSIVLSLTASAEVHAQWYWARYEALSQGITSCGGSSLREQHDGFPGSQEHPDRMQIMLEGNFSPSLVHKNYSGLHVSSGHLCVWVCECASVPLVKLVSHEVYGVKKLNTSPLKGSLVTDLFLREGGNQTTI